MTIKEGFWEPFSVGRPHGLTNKVLDSGGLVEPSGGAMFEILPTESGGTALFIFHFMPKPTASEIEGYVRGPIKVTLSEIDGRIHLVLLTGVGNAEMCYEPLLMKPKDRPVFEKLETQESRFVVTYLLADSETRNIEGIRAFSLSAHMSQVLVKLVTERCATPGVLSRAEHDAHMARVARKHSIPAVAKLAIAYTRHDRLTKDSIEFINI